MKLGRLGVTGLILGWLHNFLMGRSFCVRVGNHVSESTPLRTGVPQDSILSPVLFNVMLYDFPEPRTPVECLQYADDIEVHVTAKNADEAERLLQPYLDRVEWWARKWKFKFSANKSATLFFSRSRKPGPRPEFFIGGHRILLVKPFKFLGVLFDEKLTWNHHIEQVIMKCIKVRNIFSVLTKHKQGPTTATLMAIFKTTMHSKVDYEVIAYGSAA